MKNNHIEDFDSLIANVSKQAQEAGERFREYLWSGIPISEKMNISALPLSRTQFCLSAPLEPNRNVHGTAFAGSLYTVMSMAGWGLIRVELDRCLSLMEKPGARADLWLTRADIRYIAPVENAFYAVAQTDERSLDSFWHKLSRKGRGKTKLSVHIGGAEGPRVTLHAEYAAKLILSE